MNKKALLLVPALFMLTACNNKKEEVVNDTLLNKTFVLTNNVYYDDYYEYNNFISKNLDKINWLPEGKEESDKYARIVRDGNGNYDPYVSQEVYKMYINEEMHTSPCFGRINTLVYDFGNRTEFVEGMIKGGALENSKIEIKDFSKNKVTGNFKILVDDGTGTDTGEEKSFAITADAKSEDATELKFTFDDKEVENILPYCKSFTVSIVNWNASGKITTAKLSIVNFKNDKEYISSTAYKLHLPLKNSNEEKVFTVYNNLLPVEVK